MAEETGFQLSGSAPARYERFIAPIMAPFVAALLDVARPTEGAAVLDVACGTGFAARAAARMVGENGRVVGVDINPGMLDTAAASTLDTRPVIEWRQAPADHLPVDDAAFDAVVCQQGLQFFPDRQAALDEMVRVARPGGRVAVTVWAPIERSPYMVAQYEAVRSILGSEGSQSFVAAFSCSAEDASSAFRAAGLRDVEVREVVAEVRLPDLPSFLVGHLSALPWGAALQEARTDGIDLAVTSMMRSLAAATSVDGSLIVPFESVLVSGTR